MCLGSTDLPMGPEGLAQARAMAAQLPVVTAVFSSPLKRAVQTAGALGQEVTILQDLRELHAGEWEGLTFAQIRERYPSLYEARGMDESLPPPGAEDHAAGLTRFQHAMQTAAVLAPGDFAVVAHGGIISQFLKDLTGILYKPDYCEAIPLVWEHGQFLKQEDMP